MDHSLELSVRIKRLRNLSQQVRKIAISRQGDIAGWRISRLLCEASTPAEADEAERQLETWERSSFGNMTVRSANFAIRETPNGWVVDVTKSNGDVQQLFGLFTTKDRAVEWMSSHPVDWWRLRDASTDSIIAAERVPTERLTTA